jgi:hypothetical protein
MISTEKRRETYEIDDEPSDELPLTLEQENEHLKTVDLHAAGQYLISRRKDDGLTAPRMMRDRMGMEEDPEATVTTR